MDIPDFFFALNTSLLILLDFFIKASPPILVTAYDQYLISFTSSFFLLVMNFESLITASWLFL